MKKEIFVSLIVLFFSFKIFSQSPGPKWEKVFESKDLLVYVDTSSIKKFENQISVLGITTYKKPQMITSLNKEASSIKNQLLFNSSSRKYTVIGTLYYDKNQKILGETSLPGFASNNDNFSLSVEGNEVMTAILNKAAEYLKIELGAIEQKYNYKSGGNIGETPVQDQKNKSKDESPKSVNKDSMKAAERVSKYITKKDSVQKEQVKSNPSKPSTEKSTTTPEANQSVKTEKPKPIIDSKPSESDVETNPKSTIFKVGSKYSFQVSSWKKKTVAENEVRKLKAKGHNAFITEAIVKGAKWYRVRIGYFNSIEETEQYKRNIK